MTSVMPYFLMFLLGALIDMIIHSFYSRQLEKEIKELKAKLGELTTK